jgi:hypothetical protein
MEMAAFIAAAREDVPELKNNGVWRLNSFVKRSFPDGPVEEQYVHQPGQLVQHLAL